MEVINGIVYDTIEVVTEKQTATKTVFFDQEFHIKMTTDKTTILADATDIATITATVYNYLDEPQDYTSDVIFEVNGEQQTVTAVNGVAEITFATELTGEYEIKTIIPNFRNGSVKVVAE